MIAQRLRVARVLWGAILVSTVMFLGMALYSTSTRGAAVAPDPIVLAVLAVVAVAASAMSLFVPSIVTRAGLARLPLAVRDLPPDEAMLREQGQRKRVLANREQALTTALPVLMSSLILGLALAEAVALFGFVLLYLGHSFGRAIGFFVVLWVLISLRLPTEAQFRKQVQDGYDADFA